MPLDAPGSPRKKRRDARFAFFIISGFAVAFFGMALALGIEPRMHLVRSGLHVFRVTGSNHFAGYQFFSKTIEGVEGARVANASRNRREDSIKERQRQMKQKRLEFIGAYGATLGWGRETDFLRVDEYMRGAAPTLSLTDPPPWWRTALSWLCLGLGALTFLSAVKNLFPKTEGATPWS